MAIKSDESVPSLESTSRFSLTSLLKLIFVVALALALGRLSLFSVLDIIVFIASLLVVRQLYIDIKTLRQLPMASREIRLQVQARWLLLGSIVGAVTLLAVETWIDAVPLADRGNVLRFLLTPSIHEAHPSVMVLQLCFFGCLIMDGPIPRHSKLWLPIAVCGVVWIAAIAYGHTTIIMLVHSAIEAMEVSIDRAHAGPGSQYAVDSANLYAGLGTDLVARKVVFARVSMFAIVPVVFLPPTITWVILRIRRGLPVRRQGWFLGMLILVAAVYPTWIYATGLRHLCPAYAAAGSSADGLSMLGALLALAVASCLITVRGTTLIDATPMTDLPPLRFVTLLAIGVTSVSWIIWRVFMNGGQFWSFSFAACYQFLHWPNYIATATMLVLGARLLRGLMGVPPVRRVVGQTPARSVRLIFPAVFVTILITAATLWWCAYAFALSVYYL